MENSPTGPCLRFPVAVITKSRRDKEDSIPVSPFRPAYCIGDLIASAAVASAEDHKHPPLPPRDIPVMLRHPIPYRRIAIILRTSANSNI